MRVNLANSAFKNLQAIEKDLTRAIKVAAKRAGWPSTIANTLSIRVLRDEIVVNYPETHRDAIDDLEYGTRITNPKPVFRMFINKHIDKLTANLEDTLAKELARLEG